MKAIFITGAAQGIGLAIARLFAEKGWLVGLYDINENLCKDHFETLCFNARSRVSVM